MNYKNKLFLIAVLIFGILFFVIYNFNFNINIKTRAETKREMLVNSKYLQKEVLPREGVKISVEWGNLGKKMVDFGVIDVENFKKLYEGRGGLTDKQKAILYGENNGSIVMNADNANFLLNIFWALGLSNKNDILEKGEMSDSRYGSVGNFASTGGWTLAKGNSIKYFSKYKLISLTKEQQNLVNRVSKGIFRPCCGNSTHFPDCNHGMAMLGVLELMASQGSTEEEMYNIALKINSFWFPETYLTIAKYFGMRGVEWKNINAKTVLGSAYSGGQGYRQILQEIEPEKFKGGGSC